jgi:hypothetical protein
LKLLGAVLARVWPALIIAAIARFAVGVALGFPTMEHLIPRSIGFGLVVFLFSILPVWLLALITKQRNAAVVARRAWILAAVLVVLSIIGFLHPS